MKRTIELLQRLPLSSLGENVCLSFETTSLYVDGKTGEVSELPLEAVVTFELLESDLLSVLLGKASIVRLFVDKQVMVRGSYPVAFKFKNILG